MEDLSPTELARLYAELGTIAQVLRENDPHFEERIREALERPRAA